MFEYLTGIYNITPTPFNGDRCISPPPSPGDLVLFPSYFWHGTLPFTSAQPRLTVAFDALPA